MGELLRSIGARATLNKNEKRLRMLLARNNQFGVAVSGASGGLIHWRCTLEEAIKAGSPNHGRRGSGYEKFLQYGGMESYP